MGVGAERRRATEFESRRAAIVLVEELAHTIIEAFTLCRLAAVGAERRRRSLRPNPIAEKVVLRAAVTGTAHLGVPRIQLADDLSVLLGLGPRVVRSLIQH